MSNPVSAAATTPSAPVSRAAAPRAASSAVPGAFDAALATAEREASGPGTAQSDATSENPAKGSSAEQPAPSTEGDSGSAARQETGAADGVLTLAEATSPPPEETSPLVAEGPHADATVDLPLPPLDPAGLIAAVSPDPMVAASASELAGAAGAGAASLSGAVVARAAASAGPQAERAVIAAAGSAPDLAMGPSASASGAASVSSAASASGVAVPGVAGPALTPSSGLPAPGLAAPIAPEASGGPVPSAASEVRGGSTAEGTDKNQLTSAFSSELRASTAAHGPAAPSGLATPVPAAPSGLAAPVPAAPSGLVTPVPAAPSGLVTPVPAAPSGLAAPVPAAPSGLAALVPAAPSGSSEAASPDAPLSDLQATESASPSGPAAPPSVSGPAAGSEGASPGGFPAESRREAAGLTAEPSADRQGAGEAPREGNPEAARSGTSGAAPQAATSASAQLAEAVASVDAPDMPQAPGSEGLSNPLPSHGVAGAASANPVTPTVRPEVNTTFPGALRELLAELAEPPGEVRFQVEGHRFTAQILADADGRTEVRLLSPDPITRHFLEDRHAELRQALTDAGFGETDVAYGQRHDRDPRDPEQLEQPAPPEEDEALLAPPRRALKRGDPRLVAPDASRPSRLNLVV